MESRRFYLLFLIAFCTNFIRTFSSEIRTPVTGMYPFTCSKHIKTCNAILYQHNNLTEEQISVFYSVNVSQIRPFAYGSREDYLVTAPCSCKNVNGTIAYFYDTTYTVQPNDTFPSISTQVYSGQAWNDGGDDFIIAGQKLNIDLLCGCEERKSSEIVVTYTVQAADTIWSIANLFSTTVKEIQRLNKYLGTNPHFLDVGWLLYVPMNVD